MAEAQQDVDALKRRGRRRLVGAVALVLLAVIVLPMVFDAEPRNAPPPVSVRIPGQDDAPFAPKLPAKPPEAAKAIEKPAEKAVEKAVEKIEPPVEKKAAPKPKSPEVEKPKISGNVLPSKPSAAPKAPPPAERARAEAALTDQGQFFVQIGAYANPEAVIGQLKAAKLPYYTEQVAVKAGKVTRVRAGPFGSKAAADKAAERLKGLGLNPGPVAAKAG